MRAALFFLLIAVSHAAAAGRHFTVHHPASQQAGELKINADFTLWIPDGVKNVRAIIVHQHGCGAAANAAGETAAHDLHWQALAAKWDAALLSPRYHQVDVAGREGCVTWMDPRNGSRQAFLHALDVFAKQSGHAEIKTAPWCLWGHSGGGYWSSLMQTFDAGRVVAAWLRSGTAFVWWESGQIEKPLLTDEVYRIPTMLNPGIKESTNDKPESAWLGSMAMFKAYRAKDAPVAFAADPLSGHDCGDSRYLAIPFFDSCLALRLGDAGPALRAVDMKQGWLAELMSRKAEPPALFKGKRNLAVWLPDERVAKAWMEYVTHGSTNDATPPPAPVNITVKPQGNGANEITWDAAADLESGLRAFAIERDGKPLAQVPETPIGKFGRPLFQTMSFHDTPEPPLPAMRFMDTTAKRGTKHEYRVIAINSAGLRSAPPAGGSPLAKITPADGDTFVFLGDSITAQCLYTQYLENYFYTRYPHLRLHFHNAGVSGDTAADALARFDRDVAAYRPKYVTILLGMNDGGSSKFEPALFDTYRADMQTLIGKVRAIGATPILITPTMYDERMAAQWTKPDRRGRGGYYNGVLALYGSWIRETACAGGLGFVDTHGLLNQFTLQGRKTDPAFTLIPDGIHPDAGGQIIMTYGIASDLGLSKRSSTIEISRGANDQASAKVTGGKVSAARFTNEGLEFTFQPAGLPMSVPAAAATGAQLIPLGHRLSYEALYIHGLAPGKYRLLINDIEIGAYTSDVLESKLELESNPQTPQYQQAERVAALNAQRNSEAIVPLRALWVGKKTLERTKRELAAAPDDETLKKRITAYERKLADFDAQVAAFDAKAKTIEDQIYQTNQPQPLRFRVVRAAGSPSQEKP